MLATEILTKDHHKAINLIEELEGAVDGTGSYAKTFNKLEAALLLHMKTEEEIYYPSLAQYDEFRNLEDISVPEHETVRQQLNQLSELAPSSREFRKFS